MDLILGQVIPFGVDLILGQVIPFGVDLILGQVIPFGVDLFLGQVIPFGVDLFPGQVIPFGMDLFPGQVIPFGVDFRCGSFSRSSHTSDLKKLALQWLPCQVPGVVGYWSAQRAGAQRSEELSEHGQATASQH